MHSIRILPFSANSISCSARPSRLSMWAMSSTSLWLAPGTIVLMSFLDSNIVAAPPGTSANSLLPVKPRDGIMLRAMV